MLWRLKFAQINPERLRERVQNEEIALTLYRLSSKEVMTGRFNTGF